MGSRRRISSDGRANSLRPKGDSMNTTEQDKESIPWMQQLLDNPFLLLFIGVMVPMVVYTLWGVIDILTVPLAK
jgi:hypothetical protein